MFWPFGLVEGLHKACWCMAALMPLVNLITDLVSHVCSTMCALYCMLCASIYLCIWGRRKGLAHGCACICVLHMQLTEGHCLQDVGGARHAVH